ncbi:DUF2953 domain-containing protein [Thermoflavimicrobium dichotomicum]|uniref:DUF2953 domain-containing protein n=1 Tax=Thermoflavimicrobium dichotomicum TaxID=46223 RepID=A0A1I3TVN8_9BACL|nr:DUF2953 domain-containing protein [Thermoflavimicrobium dichotomicum]SFJ75324.1 Protein of unknown function [Thermoflavimicrobium dichotomicum]
MKFFLWVGMILVALLIILPFTSVRIELLFKWENENDRGEVKIRALFGLVRLRFTLPQLDWAGIDRGLKVSLAEETNDTSPKKEIIGKKTIQRGKEMVRELLDQIDGLKEILRWFFSKVTCEKWVWITSVGTGDAAEAGFLTGIVWTLKSMLIGWISPYIRWQKAPELHVEPLFYREAVGMTFHSIIRFRLGHAILAIKRLYWDRNKRRNLKWQSIQSKA